MSIEAILKKHAAWLSGDAEMGERANLRGSDLRAADFVDADLGGADFGSADLGGANLWNADLRGANLCGANLWNADFRGADLRKANLRDADLKDANLMDADLRGADLRGANLWCCTGNMTHIKSVFCERYSVTYTSDVMQIDCQRHLIADWWGFDDKRILGMKGRSALDWWRVWKPILQQIISESPALASEHEVAWHGKTRKHPDVAR